MLSGYLKQISSGQPWLRVVRRRFGGAAARDERNIRAKTYYSFRSSWASGTQKITARVMNMFNSRLDRGEHSCISAFPNWTRADVGSYTHVEKFRCALNFASGRERGSSQHFLSCYRPPRAKAPAREEKRIAEVPH